MIGEHLTNLQSKISLLCLIQKCSLTLKVAKYFTKLNLSQGFHQLRLTKEDRAKSAITTRYGNFEWTVASFGMTNVPSVFSRVVGNVLWDYQDKFVINFLDDILIYSPDFESHMEHIQQVLHKLKEASLYANPEKCTWCATSVFYLGHEISSEGIRVSKEKITSYYHKLANTTKCERT